MRPNSRRGTAKTAATGQEARRQAAGAAGRGAAADRSDQSDRRGLAHHAGGGRRLRAVLQRAGRGGGGQPAGGRDRCRSGAQRQAAARADAGQDRRPCPKRWARPKRCWPTAGYFSAANVAACAGGRDRAADRHGPAAASSAAGASASPRRRRRRTIRPRSRPWPIG